MDRFRLNHQSSAPEFSEGPHFPPHHTHNFGFHHDRTTNIHSLPGSNYRDIVPGIANLLIKDPDEGTTPMPYHAGSEATLAEENLSPPLQSPRKRIGDYELIKTIGQGTFGKVKLAEHIVTREKIAIKSILKANVKTTKQMNSVQRE
ncbi:Protein kinase, partial [Blyttiomyces sp. JEL0837]